MTAFAVMLQVTFIATTGAIGVVALIATLGLAALFNGEALVRDLIGRPLVHVFWALALLSAAWSVEPALTLRYGIQLALTTFIAMLLPGFGRGEGAMQGVALAFPIFLVVSVASGQSVAMGAGGDTAFAGLTGSKNLLAGTAATGLLAMTAAAVDCFERRRVGAGLFFCATGVLAGYVILLARSSGVLMTTALTLPVLVAMLILRGASHATRSVILLVVLLLLVLSVIYLDALASMITDWALQTFDKSPTLTGRVYLWQRADEIIRQRPWLGLGYSAFWVKGNLDAEGLWRWAGIVGRGGFNFHGTMREVLVHFGWIGLCVLAAALAVCLARFARLFVLGSSVGQIFWFCVLVQLMMSFAWESFLPTPFNMSSFTFIAAVCASCSPAAAVPRFQQRTGSRWRSLRATPQRPPSS